MLIAFPRMAAATLLCVAAEFSGEALQSAMQARHAYLYPPPPCLRVTITRCDPLNLFDPPKTESSITTPEKDD